MTNKTANISEIQTATRQDDFADAPVAEQEQAEARIGARIANTFSIDPITRDELKALGYEDGNIDVDDGKARMQVPQDWAESLTGLNLAVRDLNDSVAGKDKAKTEDAFQRLSRHRDQLMRFLRMRGLAV